MKKSGLKFRLSVMIFLQFAVLGSYITSMGGYLSSIGLSAHIGVFYAMGGFAALVTPALMGILADRRIPSQRLYGMMHCCLGVCLLSFGVWCRFNISSVNLIWSLIIYSTIPLLVIPTIPLAYSTIYAVLNRNGMNPERDFPRIRVYGTIGFIFSMLAVDFLGLQHSYGQFIFGAVSAFILAAWSFLIPNCPPVQNRERTKLTESLKLFRNPQLCIFFILFFCMGMLEKISEAYTSPFFSSVSVSHPNALLSVSRVAEVCGILAIPFMLRHFGVKKTISTAIAAWVVYYLSLAFGDNGSRFWLLVLSMASYGAAFSFFSIVGSIFVENTVENAFRSTAQGVMTVMTNGLGTIAGSLSAQFLYNSTVAASGGWTPMWVVLASFSLMLFVLFVVIFKQNKLPLRND